MKLLSLRLQGFMPYRESQFLDFRNKSIFALTGSTGSGKSALLDAITFAFYGKTPRWAESQPGKDLISQGESKLTVQVEFEVKGKVYQISRVVNRRGSQEIELLRFVDGVFRPRSTERMLVRETNAELRKLLGVDYGTFTRTLMLPQGQLDRMLKPKEPRERKDLLIQLAGLGFYDKLYDKLALKQRPVEDEVKRLEGQLGGFACLEPSLLPQLQTELSASRNIRKELDTQLLSATIRMQTVQQDLELTAKLASSATLLKNLLDKEVGMLELRGRLENQLREKASVDRCTIWTISENPWRSPESLCKSARTGWSSRPPCSVKRMSG